jgi:hypothetical protein
LRHRVGDAVEFDQHAVAGGLDDAAAVLRDGRIDELDPVGLETRECPGLVDLHQSTIADHVGGEDRCEPALWSRHVHLLGPFTGQSSRWEGFAQACAGRKERPAYNIPSACI